MKYLKQLFVLPFIFLLFINSVAAQDVVESVKAKLDKYKLAAAKERVLLLMDRNIYEPGELIWVDVTTFDIFTPSISSISEEVTISILNQEKYKVLTKNMSVQDGYAKGFLHIPSHLTNGIYLIQASTANSGSTISCTKKIVVRENALPRYLVEAGFPDREYIPGDQFAMNLQFKDFYNEPVKKVSYRLQLFDDDWKLSEVMGDAGKAGIAIEQVRIPMKLKSGILGYRVVASSKKGSTMLSGTIPLLTDQLFIDFYPENGRLVNGLKSEVRIHAYDPLGQPLVIEADLLEDDQPIHTFTTDQDGLGSFDIIPDIGKNYKVQMKRPLFLEKVYELPPIVAKGISLRPVSVSAGQASYQLVNGYESVRSVYLLGICNGEVFWSSEHQIDRTINIDVDLKKAGGRLAHFVIFNAAEHIEGEHILFVPEEDPSPLSISKSSLSSEIRGANPITVDTDGVTNGKYVFTAAHAPWIIADIGNQHISSIELPADINQQMVFRTRGFTGAEWSDEVLAKYLKYYYPIDFGIDKVVRQQGSFTNLSKKVVDPTSFDFLNPYLGQYREKRSEGLVVHTNMHADDLFATSNPQYYADLYKKKEQKRPAYKDMLENGVPVMDALQAVKPYTVNGNNIVFISSAISISSQGGSLIVIDGVQSGTDPFVIRNLNPRNIESIFVSTEASDIQRYTAFNTTGIIEIKTKTGVVEEEVEDPIDEDLQFAAPDYSTGKGGPADYRKTLNWVIRASSPEDQSSEDFLFYNSDLISTIYGRIHFIPRIGKPQQVTFEHEVK